MDDDLALEIYNQAQGCSMGMDCSLLIADLERQFDDGETEKNGAIEENYLRHQAWSCPKFRCPNRRYGSSSGISKVAQLNIDNGLLVGDCLFAAAFVTKTLVHSPPSCNRFFLLPS